MSPWVRYRRWQRERRLRRTRVRLVRVMSVAETLISRTGFAAPPFAIMLRDDVRRQIAEIDRLLGAP